MSKFFETGSVPYDTSGLMQNASVAPSRRRLIIWSGTAAATGLATYLGWPSFEDQTPAPRTEEAATRQPVDVPPLPAGPFHRDLFVPHLGSEFTLQPNANATATCKLVEVSPVSVMKTEKETFVAFTLLFEAHPSFLKEGGVCHVTHPQLSAMDFHLSPIGDGKKKHLLEACFTLRV